MSSIEKEGRIVNERRIIHIFWCRFKYFVSNYESHIGIDLLPRTPIGKGKKNLPI
jgi:hypothetical protein